MSELPTSTPSSPRSEETGPGAGVAGVPPPLGDPAALLPLLDDQRLPVDPVRHHQQHRGPLLGRVAGCGRLALPRLYGGVCAAHFPRHLAHR